jgi:hypothetical protein
MAESDQKPAPPPVPGSTYDPGWDSGLSGRLGGQGFMGAPPPRNPPPEPDQDVTSEGDEDFPRDREHLTEADRKGEGEGEQGEPELARRPGPGMLRFSKQPNMPERARGRASERASSPEIAALTPFASASAERFRSPRRRAPASARELELSRRRE